MARKLYPYQADAVRELLRRFKTFRRIVAVAPTGSGKTTIGAAFVAQLSKSTRVLWLAHRFELLVQARDELVAAGVSESDIGIVCGALKENVLARILLGSVQTKHSGVYDLVVVDEAHHVAASTYQAAIVNAPSVLGLTATPQRLDGKPLGETFENMFIMAETKDLGKLGYVAIPECYGLPVQEAKALVHGLYGGNDYEQGALARRMMNRVLMGNVVSECRRLALNAPTLVCAVRREHGKGLLARFLADGRRAEYLDGKTPHEVRKGMIGKGGRLETGECEVVIHVDVAGEGINIPVLGCVALCRPTKSITLHLQQMGRASRPYKGKTPIVLDHAGNCNRLGLPDQRRVWSLEGRVKGDGRRGSFVWRCDCCGVMNELEVRECLKCGASRPDPKRELDEHEAELRRIQNQEQKMLKHFQSMAAKKNLPTEWVALAMKEWESRQ